MIHIITQFSHFDILSAVELWCVCGGFGWRWRVGALRVWLWIPESASEGNLLNFSHAEKIMHSCQIIYSTDHVLGLAR